MVCRSPSCLQDGKPHATLPFIKSRYARELLTVHFLPTLPTTSTSIYLTDLDVSFVEVKCDKRCSIIYHPECFRKMKKTCTSFCPTPDCNGRVSSVNKH